MATRQVNTEESQSIKVSSLLEMPERKLKNSKLSDDNKFGSFRILE